MAKLFAAFAVLALVAPADPDLDKAAAAAGAMTAYTAKVSVTLTGWQSGTTTIEIKVQPDSAVHLKCGEADYYRKGDVLVQKEGDAWRKFEPPTKGEGGKLDKKGIQIAMLRNMKLPHEALRDLAARVGEVQKEASDGGPILTADLTAEGAREFGSVIGKRGAGGKDPLDYTGRVKVWLNAEGAMTRIEVSTRAQGQVKDRAIDFTKTTTIEISEVGRTTFEVPGDAKKALGLETPAPQTEEPKEEPSMNK